MKSFIKYFTIIIVALLGFAQCVTPLKNSKGKQSKEENIGEDPRSDAEVMVSISLDTLYSTINDTIHIQLLAEFSTGKLWLIGKVDERLKQINMEELREIEHGHKKTYQQFSFSANEKGNYRVEFVNKRPFGKDYGTKQIHKQLIIVK